MQQQEHRAATQRAYDHVRTYGSLALGVADTRRHAPVTFEAYLDDAPFPRCGVLHKRVSYTREQVHNLVRYVDVMASELLCEHRGPVELMEQFTLEYGLEVTSAYSEMAQGKLQSTHTAMMKRHFQQLRDLENAGLATVVLPQARFTVEDAMYRVAHVLNVGFTMLLAAMRVREMAAFSHVPARALDASSPFRACPFGFRTLPDMPLTMRVANPPSLATDSVLGRAAAMLHDPSQGVPTGSDAGTPPSSPGSAGSEDEPYDPDAYFAQRNIHSSGIGGANVSGNGGGPVRMQAFGARGGGGGGRQRGGASGGGGGGGAGGSGGSGGTGDAGADGGGADGVVAPDAMPAHPPRSAKEQLVSFLWRQASVQSLRHDGTHVYARVWQGDQPTCAWYALRTGRAGSTKMTIEDWVHHELAPEYRWDQDALSNAVPTHLVVQKLVSTPTSLWPLYEPDRNFVAWRNGVLQLVWKNPETGVLQPRWLDHAHPDLVSVCACKYMDLYMDPQFWDDAAFPDPMAIPTPALDTVPDTQHFDTASKRYFYGMAGRVLAPFRVADKEQKIMLMIGCAGCGKSTLINLIKSFFPRERVGTLATNVQDRWAVGNIVGCWVWMLPELKSHLSLNQGTLQKMVSGEEVGAEKKGVQEYETILEANGIIAGNELATNLSDTGGAITRRFFYVCMDHRPTVKDGTLEKRIFDERAAVFAKMIRCYYALLGDMRELSAASGRTVDLDTILPPQFTDMRKRLQVEVQPMTSLLTSPQWFTMPPPAVNKFWHAYVDHKGALADGAPRNGVTPATHPDFFMDDQLVEDLLPEDPRDYVAPTGGAVYAFDEYRVTERTLQKAWMSFCDENQVRAELRNFNAFNVKSTAPALELNIVSYMSDARTGALIGAKRARTGGAAAASVADGAALDAAASPTSTANVPTFAVHGVKLLRDKLDMLRAAAGGDDLQ